MSNKKYFLSLLLIVLVIGGCKKKQFEKRIVKIPVKTVVLKKVKYEVTQPVYGISKGDVSYLRALNTGKIEKIYHREGDFVRKNETVMEIGTSIAKINLNSAKAKFEETEKNFNRTKKLFEKGLISKSNFEKVKLMYDVDKNRYELAKNSYEYSFVKAPFSGYLEDFDFKEGEFLTTGTPVGKISSSISNRIEGNLPLNFSNNKISKKIKFIVGEKSYNGKLRYISKDFIRGTKFKKIIIEIDKKDKIPPESDVIIKLVVGGEREGLLLPINSVLFTDKGKRVFTVEKGKAKSNIVETGDIVNDMIEIKSGLKAGDKVVIVGQQYLTNGSEIEER